MSINKKFIPVRGIDSVIQNMAYNDGYIYFATDTKKIYMDADNRSKILMGGGGSGSNSGIYYANRELGQGETDGNTLTFSLNTIDGSELPSVNDLIFNTPNKSFYRVTSIDSASQVTGTKLAVSGSGGGGGSLNTDIEMSLSPLTSANLINGQAQNIKFTVTSAKNSSGNIIDSTVQVAWTLAYTEDGGQNYTTYATGRLDNIPSGQEYSFDFGSKARESSSSRLTLLASQLNSLSTVTRQVTFTTSDLSLSKSASFSNVSYFNTTNVTLQCNQIGNMDKILEYYWDDELLTSVNLNSESDATQTLKVHNLTTVTNGYHKVKIVLSQSINNTKGTSVAPLEFEIATWDGASTDPIIWLGEYQTEYYNYDNIQIPFRVYDPTSASNTTVHLYKDNIELDSSPRIITDTSKFSLFEITDADMAMQNYYTIGCGENTRRDIFFTVVQDPNRADFGIQKEAFLKLSFDARGRSNSESELKRSSWSYGTGANKINATFTNFNWYNNGWITENGVTCLRISNGASFSIPLGTTTFANPDLASQQSNTFEFQFKIRNVQDYSNLIRNITRYKNDADLYAEFYNTTTNTYKTSYTNYDSFLAYYLKNNYVPYQEEGGNTRALEYDDLEFDYVSKQINLSNVACGYYSGNTSSAIGICLGPQDAFFSNGTNTVNVSYIENEVINVSVVYSYSNNLMYIYINGVLTGVIKKSTTGLFTINNNSMVFNSEYCDIDLYKIRVYNTDLNVNDIVTNYAVDLKNVTTYDQNKLAEENTAINEYQFSYRNMINYNNNHPTAPLMPYIIFDTSKSNNGDKLSYAKSVNVDVGIEFVNTPLELAYTSGELEDLAKADGLWVDGDDTATKAAAVKKYYQYHCPSFVSDHANMAVQGTSSEFYPRRNYKIKTKTTYHLVKDEEATAAAVAANAVEGSHKLVTPVYKEYVGVMLNRGPFAADYAADIAGYNVAKFVKSTGAFDASKKYYSDSAGTTQVSLTLSTYQPNTYYVANSAYTELGKEKTRQKYWYMDNYTCGTTKFTMKIDFMESSGSYNMGFANLVKNAYSKHPFDDYNNAGAFQVDDPDNTVYTEASSFEEGTTYYYKNHKGNWKNTKDDELNIMDTAEEFALGPTGLGVSKVLKSDSATGSNASDVASAASAEGLTADAFVTKYLNKWYTAAPALKQYAIPNTTQYRTSVQGFRVLAFHKKSDGSYTYIGMYNILIDKGSDECYGFKPDKTTGATIYQKFLNGKKVPKIAECWEFSNNSRTFCSFRDPLNRKDLSFDVYTMNGGTKVPTLSSTKSSPVVTDSFEYRFHADGDILDYIYDPDKNGDKYKSEDCVAYMDEKNKELLFDKNDTILNYADRSEIVFKDYKNWEKAVAWVWSTNTDSVGAQGEYAPVNVGKTTWTASTYYVYNSDTASYSLDTGTACDDTITYYNRSASYQEIVVQANADVSNYYTKSGSNYIQATGTAVEGVTYYEIVYTYANAHVSTHLYSAGQYYTKVNGSYVLSNDSTFDESADYYSLNEYTDAQMEQGVTIGSITTKYDRLVSKCASSAVYDSSTVYYSYDGSAHPGEAVVKLDPQPTAEQFAANPTNYYVGISKTYGTKTYKFDTKEYRAAKFVAELENHFDLEYMATYFVMTEVFECYDSRGKNCMMASWGPQTEGGDYIWYPIFYDIDTQLGINNTGIPSFEYNVDATEDGNYSTSDSILWNNFYKYFKSSAILMKYKHLKGVTAGVDWTALNKPPLKTVANIESWYLTDSDVCGSIAMRGDRPLIATNLDEYYKYITITNNKSYQNGVTGHISSDSNGTWTYDANGTYFYALQGNRSLSRQQFLANRLEYIDSWLNQGNYQRGGSNRIAGRVAANNATKTSDQWVESDNDTSASGHSYYLADGTKRHQFDAEYWVTLTPTHSSYVTLGDDNEAYPSKKYDGINPVKFNIDSIENGVRKSSGYPEQLLYIYGLNQMADLGDMSNLYWQEFRIEGDASHLTKLKLGYDGLDSRGERWHNDRVNQPSIPSGADATGMPLLKEANFCNMQINTGTPVLDLTSCEKLKNFRATGSNFTDIKFAKGVALDTLYLPVSITALELTEARLLKNLLTTYTAPVKNTEGDLEAEPGLWIEGMFNSNTTNIATLNIAGGGLGYDSYKLLKKYYDIRKLQTSSISKISMTNVVWTPFVQVESGTEYISSEASSYFTPDNHYGMIQYSYNAGNWETQVSNGEIYKKDSSINNDDINQIDGIVMLEDFISNNLFKSTASQNNDIPEITGTIYVNNSTAIDEYYIRNTLQVKYPALKFFFANVTKKYTARFILLESDGSYKYVSSNPDSIQTINSGWFEEPNVKYGNITALKANYDFYGWAKLDDVNGTYTIGAHKYKVISAYNFSNSSYTINNWNNENLENNIYDYTYYAIFDIHKYNMTFIDGNNNSYIKPIIYNYVLTGPTAIEFIPKKNDSNLAIDKTYKFLGWSLSENGPIVDLSAYRSTKNYTFYAIFEESSVYDNVIDNSYLTFTYTDSAHLNDGEYSIPEGYKISIKSGVSLSGKITLPTYYENKPVVIVEDFSSLAGGENITHIFFDNKSGENKIRRFNYECFSNCSQLKYVEYPTNLRMLIGACFSNCISLASADFSNTKIYYIGPNTFAQCFKNNTTTDISFGNTLYYIATPAFSYCAGKLGTLRLGTSDLPIQSVQLGSGSLINEQNYGYNFTRVIIYCNENLESSFITAFNTYSSPSISLEDIYINGRNGNGEPLVE